MSTFLYEGLSPLTYMFRSWSFLLLLFTPVALFARRLQMPKSMFGLTTVGWRRATIEGVGFGLILSGMIIVLKIYVLNDGGPVFNWNSLTNYGDLALVVFFVQYLPHTFIQELIARGVIQGALQKFMSESHRLIPLLLTAALFGLAHTYVGLAFVFLTFVASAILGYLYLRHGNLIGVTATHFLAGITSVAVGLN